MGIKKAQQNIVSILLLSSTVYRYLLAGANMVKVFEMAKEKPAFIGPAYPI